MDPESPFRSKILQWLPVDSSINSHWHSTLISIFIIHALAVPHLQLILQTPYTPAT